MNRVEPGEVLESKTGWMYSIEYHAGRWTVVGTRMLFFKEYRTEKQFVTKSEMISYLRDHGCGRWTLDPRLLR